MYAIMGASGRVGGAVVNNLLDAGQAVSAVVRNAARAAAWQARGCEVKEADAADSAALAAAFSGCEGAFVLLPPAYDQAAGLEQGHRRADAIRQALLQARPSKVVALSTYGAQVTRANLFNELGYLEQVLADLEIPVTILRAAWYMENHEWDVATARSQGVIYSHLQPLDQPLPMVSTRDVGRMAAHLLMETWSGHRVVEFEGPAPVSPQRLAEAFARALDKKVRAEAVPRDHWEQGFQQIGIKNPEPWMQSLDGTNEGWLAFEGAPETRRRGQITIDEAIAALL
ncbi:NmrA family NAD(P)-binding protein [Pokkaliibacter sp. MBI-7]|uniref:NmrA family NAD(P)-binding protein n=1 Tax=Pokkaliibacter sp. MBI-7 TaxID=3040600 RepID=UPI002449814E|nr:NmrA family NAD(P)-binding protein [Pokkaliibacter sp. MBI-7]MDH2433700.1 NmrA family NAD(P)-binding protein [Pokkaliibacter sp. MBI-7]